MVTLAFKRLHWSRIGLHDIRPQSASTALLRSANYILMNDLVRCGSPLQIVMAVWHTFFLRSDPNSHYTVKKVSESIFLSTTRMSLNKKLSLTGNNLINTGQSDIPAGDGKIANLFYNVMAAWVVLNLKKVCQRPLLSAAGCHKRFPT